ncbi:hypothetical protein PGT21_035172 [Puccinia graminis f. sp. tritici]|uniref:Uncharacterized protein n=1 Tax=Puccinia graminis f. sp. tritici TaxID=56615 RepID=A0A5B0PCQ6_PUCGR|nr:hypothetical protein PGT21_035172 [Puccinia graminis f. sp. tritici]
MLRGEATPEPTDIDMRDDDNFGTQLGANPPDASHQADHRRDIDPESESDLSELPDDPLEFLRILQDTVFSRENTMDFARRIFASEGIATGHFTTVIYLETLRRLQATPTAGLIAPIDLAAANFTFGNHIRGFLRDRIRQILTTHNVDAYTQNINSQGRAIERTPLLILRAHVDAQDPAFWGDFLPAGYPEDQSAQLTVMRFMRVLLKHERGQLRNLAYGRRSIEGSVPPLMDLIVIIDRAMASRGRPRPVGAIRQAYNSTTKIRIAFLRLAMAENLVSPQPLNSMTIWEIIDSRLEHVSRQRIAYQRTFSEMVLIKDRELFGSLPFKDIPPETVRLPTDEDVESSPLIR